MRIVSINNNLSSSRPNERFVMNKLGVLPPHAQNHHDSPNVQREYMFALFIFRYRVLDIGLWLWVNDLEQWTPSNVVLRTSLPSHTGIVSPLNNNIARPLHNFFLCFIEPIQKTARLARACPFYPGLLRSTTSTYFCNHHRSRIGM